MTDRCHPMGQRFRLCQVGRLERRPGSAAAGSVSSLTVCVSKKNYYLWLLQDLLLFMLCKNTEELLHQYSFHSERKGMGCHFPRR